MRPVGPTRIARRRPPPAPAQVYTFFFAVMGCQFFAGVKYGRGITSQFNMDTTLNSFLLLFVIATGDGFSAVGRDARVSTPECTVCANCKVPESSPRAAVGGGGPGGGGGSGAPAGRLSPTSTVNLVLGVHGHRGHHRMTD